MTMRVITLGTGAGRPTLKRSASATGLEFEGETFLFDCGEGTQTQLMKSPFKWGKMTAIFIGHLHGDHVNGLPGLLGTLSLSGREEPLKVFGPVGLKQLLQAHRDCQSIGVQYPLEIIEITQSTCLLDGKNYQIHTKPLSHVIPCWGYIFQEKIRPGKFNREKADQEGIPSGPYRAQLVQGSSITLNDGRTFDPQDFVGPPRPGRSFAYCLDTRRSPEAVALAQGVDLLLYEATFSAKDNLDASDWGHSTAADAAHVAVDAGVDTLVLTHISQRYPSPHLLLEEASAIFPKTRMASDLQVFRVDPKGE